MLGNRQEDERGKETIHRSANQEGPHRTPPFTMGSASEITVGAGGELHQAAVDGGKVLIANRGIVIGDDHNSLKVARAYQLCLRFHPS